jgi:hypothetical protein
MDRPPIRHHGASRAHLLIDVCSARSPASLLAAVFLPLYFATTCSQRHIHNDVPLQRIVPPSGACARLGNPFSRKVIG